ncbi:hypothetical protein [Thermogutta sp.]|uniref:hypothetical protein n=1 Tax=Thermogutta sp. TaxID=1962930 RepID=UPI003C7DDECB
MSDRGESYNRAVELAQRTPEELSPRDAMVLARGLGRLAAWLLKPAVIAKAIEEQKDWGAKDEQCKWLECTLPEGPGACWIVAVRKTCQFHALRDAFVLPLRWKKGPSEKPPTLPEGLQQVANEVLSELNVSQEIKESDQWEIHPASDDLFNAAGLFFLEGDYSSAWAPLAGSLMVAAGDGKPDHRVWATGAWKPGVGLTRVEGIREKLALASEFEATQFFVPASCFDEARQLARDNNWSIEIKKFEQSTDRPREALRPYISQLRVRASKSDSEKERAKTYLQIPDDIERRQYYLDCIVEDLAERLRDQFSKEPEKLACRSFITVVSDSPELIYLMHFVFRPKASWIFYSQGNNRYRELATEVETWLKSPPVQQRIGSCQVHIEAFQDGDLGELVRCFRDLVARLLQEDDRRSLVVDVTPGKKTMSIAWALAAPRGARLVYVDSQFDHEARKPKPFTEKLTVFSLDTLPNNSVGG